VILYNEIDAYAAQWLRNLSAAGHIAPGDVDERSIEDVCPSDLARYTQCHFFAGVGVWSYALRRAGWPDDCPVWTASCPCQPFSTAGKGAGFADERHLWPSLHWLIQQCMPPIIIGEQVAAKAVEPWIDLVQTDLEALGYAFGCVAFPSASVGFPDFRERAYWCALQRNTEFIADTHSQGLQGAHEYGDATTSATAQSRCELARIHATETWSSWLSESGTPALVDAAPCRMEQISAYGNAINAEQATIFIEQVIQEIIA
jgi:DNA (cytosine-5)-methyltransferase 1